MKCNRCSKQATLHITDIREGEVHETHLCEGCAQDYLNPSATESDDSIDTSALLEAGSEERLQEMDQLACPNCGITFREFRSQGRLGCPHDYVAFEKELMPLLENIHGDTQHVGKVPKRAPQSSHRQFRLIKLRNQLRTAVDDEQYEEAAKLRDEIQSLETTISGEDADAE